ncbi:hypothetical protein Scep_024213 [Stephania cephalantha]|uniref:Uncharacterized protein n=1 Tax=Stephania cephalantha TaxID=152367 RepID=A0AAP0HTH4_9MAGN
MSVNDVVDEDDDYDELEKGVEEVSQDREEVEGVEKSNEIFYEDDEGAEEEPDVESHGGVQEDEPRDDDQEEEEEPNDGDGNQDDYSDEDQEKFEWFGQSSAFEKYDDKDGGMTSPTQNKEQVITISTFYFNVSMSNRMVKLVIDNC